MSTRVAPGVGANLLGQHSSDRNQEATAYVGNLDSQVSEELLWELFTQGGPVVNVYVPKDRVTNLHQGYGFVEFRNEDDCDYAIKVMNMIKMFGKPIRVNKASQDRRQVDIGANLFIGNLDPDVDEKLLYDTFSAFGIIVSNPKIMRDPETGNSRGFGFISYDGFDAADAAIEAMNGQFLCNKPITVSYAYKKDTKGERHGTSAERYLAGMNPSAQRNRPHTLFATAPPSADAPLPRPTTATTARPRPPLPIPVPSMPLPAPPLPPTAQPPPMPSTAPAQRPFPPATSFPPPPIPTSGPLPWQHHPQHPPASQPYPPPPLPNGLAQPPLPGRPPAPQMRAPSFPAPTQQQASHPPMGLPPGSQPHMGMPSQGLLRRPPPQPGMPPGAPPPRGFPPGSGPPPPWQPQGAPPQPGPPGGHQGGQRPAQPMGPAPGRGPPPVPQFQHFPRPMQGGPPPPRGPPSGQPPLLPQPR